MADPRNSSRDPTSDQRPDRSRTHRTTYRPSDGDDRLYHDESEDERYRRGNSKVERVHLRPPKNRSHPQHADWSKLTQRKITGYPQRLYGKTSEHGSEPDVPASKRDRYRDDVYRRENHKDPKKRYVPRDSRFENQYQKYKRLDSAAVEHEKKEYKGHANAKGRPRPNHAEEYGGVPKGDRSFHDRAGHLAQETSEYYSRATDERRRMRETFPGYDTFESSKGHKQRLDTFDKKKDYYKARSDVHYLPVDMQNEELRRRNAELNGKHKR